MLFEFEMKVSEFENFLGKSVKENGQQTEVPQKLLYQVNSYYYKKAYLGFQALHVK